jgi:ABC-type polysaccharide/polyol phosphate transport system ATPase subunit
MNVNSKIILKNVSVTGVDTSKRASSVRQFLFSGTSLVSNKLPILNDISFCANKGDRIGIVGKNGSGKSSLLKTIAGIYPTDSGTIEVSGKLAPLIEMGVGFDPELSARQNIKLALCYSGRIADYSKELEESIIDFAELIEKIDMPLKTFSSGMVARLAFSISVLQYPDILLLDEVLATGDTAFVEKSYNFMQKKLDDVSIALIVNHSVESIQKLCNRCILMKEGRIVNDGATNDIIDHYLSGQYY